MILRLNIDPLFPSFDGNSVRQKPQKRGGSDYEKAAHRYAIPPKTSQIAK